jgi:hypothetical protein
MPCNATPIVETYDIHCFGTRVGYDKTYSREKIFLVPLNLRHNTAPFIPGSCSVLEIIKSNNRFSQRTTNRMAQKMFNLTIQEPFFLLGIHKSQVSQMQHHYESTS